MTRPPRLGAPPLPTSLVGIAVDERFIGGIYSPGRGGVAVDARHIYWAARTPNETPTIARARLDGTKVDQTFVPAVGTFFELTNVGPIAVDEDRPLSIPRVSGGRPLEASKWTPAALAFLLSAQPANWTK